MSGKITPQKHTTSTLINNKLFNRKSASRESRDFNSVSPRSWGQR